MNSKRPYITVIAILVALNLGTLVFIWFNKPGRDNRPVRGQALEFLIRELALSNMQQDEFIALREGHRDRLVILRAQDRKLHERFFGMIFQATPDTAKLRALADSMAGIRRQIEMLTFDHFRQLRLLLTKKQDARFHRVFRQALERVMPAPEPPPPPAVPPPPDEK